MLIYVIEDDPQQRDYFTKTLQADQHEIVAFQDTIAAHNYFMTHASPDAALIDFRFEGGPNGLSLARQIHAIYPTAAVVMTSSYAEKDDIIDAFREGIDDFLLKPVPPKELIKRLGNAVIERRTKYPVDTTERQLGALTLNPNTRQAWWHGQPLALTRTEFTLLLQITARPGHLFNYPELYATCTGDHVDPSLAARKLKTHVFNLRHRFIEIAPDAPCPILSKRGEGLAWRTADGDIK
ncbi:MAG: response regulator transcription factor [Chloroflexota bacterium]